MARGFLERICEGVLRASGEQFLGVGVAEARCKNARQRRDATKQTPNEHQTKLLWLLELM
jgi:hypothetical protein